MTRHSQAVLDALPLAGAAWTALMAELEATVRELAREHDLSADEERAAIAEGVRWLREGCRLPEHGQLAVVVTRDDDEPETPRCGCGAERPAQVIRMVVVPDRAAE
jgi:hypothetical protein